MTRLAFIASLAFLITSLVLAAPSRRDDGQGLDICAKAYEAKVHGPTSTYPSFVLLVNRAP
jgi:hypothetical protein